MQTLGFNCSKLSCYKPQTMIDTIWKKNCPVSRFHSSKGETLVLSGGNVIFSQPGVLRNHWQHLNPLSTCLYLAQTGLHLGYPCLVPSPTLIPRSQQHLSRAAQTVQSFPLEWQTLLRPGGNSEPAFAALRAINAGVRNEANCAVNDWAHVLHFTLELVIHV